MNEELKPLHGRAAVAHARDYTFEGIIVAAFRKKSGQVRVVVEDDRGVLLIHGPTSVTLDGVPLADVVSDLEA